MNPQPTPPTTLNDAFPFWFDLIAFFPVVVVALISLYYLRHGYSSSSFMRKHTAFLDHQTDVTIKSLEQTKSFEDMIARQYAETNARADRALAQSEEAIRLHAAALEQLARMNATLSEVAGKLSVPPGTTPSSAPAS